MWVEESRTWKIIGRTLGFALAYLLFTGMLFLITTYVTQHSFGLWKIVLFTGALVIVGELVRMVLE